MSIGWVTIALSDLAWIAMAFVLGGLVRLVGLPPLIGFLIAGFLLEGLGFQAGDVLGQLADLGVTLLLFTIGLKLNLRTLIKPQVWLVASLHTLSVALLFSLLLIGLATSGLLLFAGIDTRTAVLLAFALSFSSTIFAVKVLEEKGESVSLHGRIAIGILIMQDLMAVVFLAVSVGKIPSWWALGLPLLWWARPLFFRLLEKVGHGEMLILYGLLLALGGAELFELVGMKADLGALVIGVIVANHPKSKELAESLLGFKDLFLVGFFLTIGFYGLPTVEILMTGVVLALLVPLKSVLLYLYFTRSRLRPRTALFSTLELSNYSEFGLIVGTLGVANGWLQGEWLVAIAIALTLSFIWAAPLNRHANELFSRYRKQLLLFKAEKRLPEEESIDHGGVRILVLGMGRVGAGAYDEMHQRYGDKVMSVDMDPNVVIKHQQLGRYTHLGDSTDLEFWERLRDPHKVDLIMLALPNADANLNVIRQLKVINYQGKIAAVTLFSDESERLLEAGVHEVFNVYAEAGAGFANSSAILIEGEDSQG
ncbi:MAG: cation:proton antiporter [Gammaproteobacteria bacterium]|nr:cation:proton antiporter [Gammaproteobacteria bacterium]